VEVGVHLQTHGSMVGKMIILIFSYGLRPVIIKQLVLCYVQSYLDCANDDIHHRFFYVAPLKALILHIPSIEIGHVYLLAK